MAHQQESMSRPVEMPRELRSAIERYLNGMGGSKIKGIGCGKSALRAAFFELDAIYERTLPSHAK